MVQKSTEMMFPISIKYRSHWAMPEVIREIVQNSLDETGKYEIKRLKEGLAICDNGKGLHARHLLLGVTEKENENARGKFGEGLKIACVVAERLGYHVTIMSRELLITSHKAKLTLPDDTSEEVLGLTIEHRDIDYPGTVVTINGYTGPDYSENFLYEGDPRIIKDYAVGKMLGGTAKGKLFVKGIYVEKLEDALYGYDLYNVTLEESRKVADEADVQKGIGHIWSYVGDVEKIGEFLDTKHRGGSYEAKCPLSRFLMYPANWRQAWTDTFGKNAVLQTSDIMAAQCQWLKGKPIAIFDNAAHLANDSGISTDVKYVMEHSKAKIEKVKAKDITEDQRKLFGILKKVARELGYSGRIKLVRFVDRDFGGTAHHGYIQLDVKMLRDPTLAFGALLHELTHELEGVSDNYAGMIQAFERVAGKAMAQRFKVSRRMMKDDLKTRLGV